MLIASVVSASASSPASGGDNAKAEGDAAGASVASGSGRQYTNNLGSSGSPRARVLVGAGTLGGSSSILEVLREESGTPQVEDVTPLEMLPGRNNASWTQGREQAERDGGEGQ